MRIVDMAIKLSQSRRIIPDYTKGGIHNGNLAIVNNLENKGYVEYFPFDTNVSIKLPDDIPLVIGHKKDNSYQQFKNRTFEM